MELIAIALILGIVEGLTEFIPVSSTGHLILFGEALQFSGPLAKTFDIFIQLGAILAVIALYPARFTALLQFGRTTGKNGFTGVAGIAKLAIASFPALLLGALLHDFIKERLFFPAPVAAALIAGGVVMLALESRKGAPSTKSLDDISYRQCLLIGLCQCFALWPGISRSASTIIGALLVGLDRRTAAEFSFFLAVPVLAAAVGFDTLKNINQFGAAGLPILGIGFLVSFIVAVPVMRFFISLLSRWTLRPFAWYRIALGAAVLLFIAVH